jgi:hypothetical protein
VRGTGITVGMRSSHCAIDRRGARVHTPGTTECGPEWRFRTRWWHGLVRGGARLEVRGRPELRRQ